MPAVFTGDGAKRGILAFAEFFELTDDREELAASDVPPHWFAQVEEMMREERRSGSTELRRKYAGTAASEAAAHEDYRSEKEVYSLLSHEYVAGHTSSRSPYRAVRGRSSPDACQV